MTNSLRYMKEKSKYNTKEAVSYAVDACIREGILAEFLRKNKPGVNITHH